MCEFCTEHGEGKKWYEVMQNYSAELLEQQNRLNYIRRFIPNVQKNANANIAKLTWAKGRFPFVYRFIRTIGSNHMKKIHYGQIVPLEDAEKIIDLVQSITRIACVCRNVSTGNKNGRYCFMLGIDSYNIGIDYSDLSSSLETISKEEAKGLLRQFDREGLVHSVWTMKTPFIGAICNCNHDCLAYKVQIQSNLLDMMFKAEYIADINQERCSGCRLCIKQCQYHAIDYAKERCLINKQKCYGCGVCRQVCAFNAITLKGREFFANSHPTLL